MIEPSTFYVIQRNDEVLFPGSISPDGELITDKIRIDLYWSPFFGRLLVPRTAIPGYHSDERIGMGMLLTAILKKLTAQGDTAFAQHIGLPDTVSKQSDMIDDLLAKGEHAWIWNAQGFKKLNTVYYKKNRDSVTGYRSVVIPPSRAALITNLISGSDLETITALMDLCDTNEELLKRLRLIDPRLRTRVWGSLTDPAKDGFMYFGPDHEAIFDRLADETYKKFTLMFRSHQAEINRREKQLKELFRDTCRLMREL